MKRPRAACTRQTKRTNTAAPAHPSLLARPLRLAGLTTLAVSLPLAAGAQTGPRGGTPGGFPMRAPQSPQIATSTVTSSRISAQSAPWKLEWNGQTGTLTREALGALPASRLSLTYLHTELGPKGHSKYLAWFLARDNDHFSVVWCYLNDNGRDFFCWLYDYPANQLTTLRFVGDYRFVPPPEPVAPVVQSGANYTAAPTYTGPDFTYRNWTRRSGKLDQLQILPARIESFDSPLSGGRESGRPASGSLPASGTALPAPLSSLRVVPLHEIHVAKGNGWRAGGWRELHALAYDQANDPYYLIQYSNEARGYVVDLKRAQVYTADFGQKVVFTEDPTGFGPKEDEIVGPPDVRVRRYARLEIPLASTQKNANAYTDVPLDMEFRAPDGRITRVPGFWDGGQTWRVRFTPTQIGTWSWRSYSTDPELGSQTGSFNCIADDTASNGFLAVNSGLTDRHSFSYTNGKPFLPVYFREPTAFIADSSASGAAPRTPPGGSKSAPAKPAGPHTAQYEAPGASASGQSGARTLPQISVTALVEPSDSAAGISNMPRSYQEFTRRVDQAAALGFNRFWGGYLLDPVQFAQHAQVNEGGMPFANADQDTINPAYFQWMDRRIAYCNEHGIVPDIGLTDLNASFASSLSDAQLMRLWRYAVARYSSFDVCWNLFGAAGEQSYPAARTTLVGDLARLTRKYDPIGHPQTTVVPNAQPISVATPPKTPAGPVIFRPDNPPASSGPTQFNPQFTPPGDPSGAGGAAGFPNGGRNNRSGQTGQSNGQGGQADRQGNSQRSDRQTGSAGARPGTFALPSTGNPPNQGAFAPPTGNRSNSNSSNRNFSGRGAFDPSMFDPNAMARSSRAARRRGNRSSAATDAAPPVSSNSYVVFVDPKVAADVQAERRAQHPITTVTMQADVLYARASWLDVVTLSGGDPKSLETDYALNKPLVLLDKSAMTMPDQARYRLWETVMRGGYWAQAANGAMGTAQPLDDAVTRWQAAYAKLFRQTQFNRLMPHQDMLGGPEESRADRRRRRRAQAEAAAARQNSADEDGQDTPDEPGINLADPGYDETKNQLPGPIFVLADPGWEYMVYFERGGSVTLDLLEAIGNLQQSWYNPRTGQFAGQDTIAGGAYKTFNTPDNKDWVLYLSRR